MPFGGDEERREGRVNEEKGCVFANIILDHLIDHTGELNEVDH